MCSSFINLRIGRKSSFTLLGSKEDPFQDKKKIRKKLSIHESYKLPDLYFTYKNRMIKIIIKVGKKFKSA